MVRSSDLFCAQPDPANTFLMVCIPLIYLCVSSLYSCAPSHCTFYNFRSLLTLSNCGYFLSALLCLPHYDNEKANANIRKTEICKS